MHTTLCDNKNHLYYNSIRLPWWGVTLPLPAVHIHTLTDHSLGSTKKLKLHKGIWQIEIWEKCSIWYHFEGCVGYYNYQIIIKSLPNLPSVCLVSEKSIHSNWLHNGQTIEIKVMIRINFDLMIVFVVNVFNSIYSQGENIMRSHLVCILN